MKFWKLLSLQRKMNVLITVIMLPLTIMTIYLIINLLNFSNAYNDSIRNIVTMNDFNLNFKEDMDYSMYRIIIGTASFEELKDKDEVRDVGMEIIKNPYHLIDHLRTGINEIDDSSKYSKASTIKRTQKALGYLEKVIRQIEDNTKQSGLYSKNMELLEMDVRTSTSLIQDHIQRYIYDSTVNLKEIRENLKTKANETAIICGAALGIMLIVNLILSTKITFSVIKPVRELCRATQKVAQGDFTSTVKASTKDDMQVLTNSFNHMSAKIETLIQDIRDEQKKLRMTELKLLQAQINPHFLYNTLDTIVWMAEGGQDRDVVSMVTSLSDFFRTVLSEGKDQITIREEETHIRSYLDIQKFRYEDIFDFEIQIDDSLKQEYIIKLTLQPIVENALYHGIKNKREKGLLLVTGYSQGGDICIEVQDNGIGMDKDTLDKLRKKVKGEAVLERGFGLINVEERISLNYGPQYGLEIESELGVGTKVTVRIPKKITLLSEKT